MGSPSRDAVSQLKCCANLWRELIGQCKVYTSLSPSPLENATCVCDCFVLCLPFSEDCLIGIVIVWDHDHGHGLQGCLPLRGYSGYTVFAGETVLEAFDRRNITSPWFLSSKSSKCVTTNSYFLTPQAGHRALFQSNLNDPNEHRKYSSTWHEVSLKFNQLHLKTQSLLQFFWGSGFSKNGVDNTSIYLFFPMFDPVWIALGLSWVAWLLWVWLQSLHWTTEVLRGKIDWLDRLQFGVPKCSFLFLVNSRKLNPGSVKYVFVYVYIHWYV